MTGKLGRGKLGGFKLGDVDRGGTPPSGGGFIPIGGRLPVAFPRENELDEDALIAFVLSQV
jgi:hypothetical protein